jgi:hypothetical protein
MPREEHSIFAFGVPTFKDVKESFLGITPPLKIENNDNVKEIKKQPPKEDKPKVKKPKNEPIVKNYIQSILTD